MNYLEQMKNKPTLKERVSVEVIIKKQGEQGDQKNIKLVENIDPNYDREELKKRLLEYKLVKTRIKPTINLAPVMDDNVADKPKIKKLKQGKKPIKFIIEEEDEDSDDDVFGLL
jgi:hypothetical protein